MVEANPFFRTKIAMPDVAAVEDLDAAASSESGWTRQDNKYWRGYFLERDYLLSLKDTKEMLPPFRNLYNEDPSESKLKIITVPLSIDGLMASPESLESRYYEGAQLVEDKEGKVRPVAGNEICIVSHRWELPADPDPDGAQLKMICEQLEKRGMQVRLVRLLLHAKGKAHRR